MRSSTPLSLASLAGLVRSYKLVEDYMADGALFDKFSFWDSPDPTHGFVSYKTRPGAVYAGLISASPSNVKIRVDSTNFTPQGRHSVRITSKRSHNHGLIVLDVNHMAGGICSTWPAFWTVGPNWPNAGEIDIIEGVNLQSGNSMTLHTSDGCSFTNDGAFTGLLQTPNCYINAAGQSTNAGCGIGTKDTHTYGTGFNRNGGGVYAMEWTSSAISVWFFPRGKIPKDALGSGPRPASWGKPLARFKGSCDIDSKFANQQIVFDTTFCGDWAGGVWAGSQCAVQHGPSCTDFVANNPGAFKEALWSINALKVYQDGALQARLDDGVYEVDRNGTVVHDLNQKPIDEKVGRHLRFHRTRGL